MLCPNKKEDNLEIGRIYVSHGTNNRSFGMEN